MRTSVARVCAALPLWEKAPVNNYKHRHPPTEMFKQASILMSSAYRAETSWAAPVPGSCVHAYPNKFTACLTHIANTHDPDCNMFFNQKTAPILASEIDRRLVHWTTVRAVVRTQGLWQGQSWWVKRTQGLRKRPADEILVQREYPCDLH